MRIAIVGIAVEASTFCLHRTRLEDFHVTRGQELLDRYDFVTGPAGWAADVEWVPVLHANAMPGGPVDPTAYSGLEAEIVAGLHGAGELDGVLLDIHGAMTVAGLQDAEARLAARVRDAVGADVLVSASMNLHGNVSRDLVELVDLITCYRTAPHEDERESRERAARNLVARIGQGDLRAGPRGRGAGRRPRRRGLGGLRLGRRTPVPCSGGRHRRRRGSADATGGPVGRGVLAGPRGLRPRRAVGNPERLPRGRPGQ